MEITISTQETEKSVSKWDGKETTRYNQWCLLQQGSFVLSFTISHDEESSALPPGKYQLDPTSFSTKNGRLSVERVRLKPMAQRSLPAKA